jgi:hypothetical protein
MSIKENAIDNTVHTMAIIQARFTAEPAMPVKPKNAANNAITKNVIDQAIIVFLSSIRCLFEYGMNSPGSRGIL